VSVKKIVTTYAKTVFRTLDDPFVQEWYEKHLLENKIKYPPTIYIIREELLLIRAVINTSKTIKEVFTNPTYLEEQKLDVILKIFPGLTITMKALLRLLTEKRHLSLLPEISDEYNKIILKFVKCTKVKIITASSLQKHYSNSLLHSLKHLTGAKNTILTMSYNPKLLGGIIVEYGSSSVDASILKEFGLFFDEG
jgi:ATP synthase F1 delta subunit